MWFAVMVFGLIVVIAVFVIGVLVGIMADNWLFKETAPDLFRAYQERKHQKEEWKNGQSNGSA